MGKLSLSKGKLSLKNAEPECPFSNRMIGFAVDCHMNSFKYHTNMLNPKNKFRRNLDGTYDRSQPITDQDRAYHTRKIKAMKKHMYEINQSKKKAAKAQPKPSQPKTVTLGSGMRVRIPATVVPMDEKTRARKERFKVAKEINGILKLQSRAWKGNVPLVKSSGATVSMRDQIIAIVKEYTANMNNNRRRKTGVVAGKRRVIRTR